MTVDAPLSTTIMIGSILEGLLLGVAKTIPMQYNTSKKSPKTQDGKIASFDKWTLNSLIEVSNDIGVIKEDVKQFASVVKNFRNYIHPFEQIKSGFDISKETVQLSYNLLSITIDQIIVFLEKRCNNS